jgi:integrase
VQFFKIGKVYYVRTDPVTKRKLSTGCTSKAAAELWGKEREKLAANPAYRTSYEATLSDWADRTYEGKRLAGKASATVEMYRIKLGHVVRVLLPDTRLVHIGPSSFERYWAGRREEGAADATIGKELVCLRQLLKRAKRAGEYTGDISTLWPEGLSLESKARERWLTPEELVKLKAACEPNEWAWVAACVATSGRLSEVNRLRVEDYDPVDKVLHVRGTKTEGADRKIPILPEFEPLWAEALPHLPVSWPNVSSGSRNAVGAPRSPRLPRTT